MVSSFQEHSDTTLQESVIKFEVHPYSPLFLVLSLNKEKDNYDTFLRPVTIISFYYFH